jgi:hypothetical protein
MGGRDVEIVYVCQGKLRRREDAIDATRLGSLPCRATLLPTLFPRRLSSLLNAKTQAGSKRITAIPKA